MPLTTEARIRLADQQTALVQTLMTGGEPLKGFDLMRFRAAAASLARKRERAAARAWPPLARTLGRQFRQRFADFAETAALPRNGGPLADGRAFARWLAARGQLPQAARHCALAVDLRFRSKPDGLVPRKWPTCRVAWLQKPRRLMVAVWLPWHGERLHLVTIG